MAEIISHATDCENIHYQPAVPADDIVSHTAGADIGVFITRSEALSYRYSLPNKFFEYAHAGLPILVSANLSYLSELVASNSLGWSVPAESIAEKVRELVNIDLEPFRQQVRTFAADAVYERDAEVFRTVYRP
jgi:glycosyltransferase involved in cell wall biosynthesis